MEIPIRALDLPIELADTPVDVCPLPRERVRLPLDLGVLLVCIPRLEANLFQRLLRGLDSVRRAGALDSKPIEFLLELFRFLAAPVRHLLLEFTQACDRGVERLPKLRLLAFELRLVGLVLCNLFLRPDDLPRAQLTLLVGELRLGGRASPVVVFESHGPLAVCLD